MNFFKIFITGSLLAWGIFFFFSPSSAPKLECKNIFSSTVYQEFCHQLKVFTKEHPLYGELRGASSTPFPSQTNAFFDLIEAEEPQDGRAHHEEFTTKLRKLLNNPQPPVVHQMLDAIVRRIYLGTDLNQAYQEFLPFSPKGNLYSYLSETQRELKKDPKFQGRDFHSKEEDTFFLGNLPSVYHAGPPLRLIRCAKPLDFSSKYPWCSSRVSPEFHRFISLQPKHFYVNLMKRKGKEGRDSHAIEQLEAVYPDFYVITLDKNSPFYWQNTSAFKDISLFKQSFLERLLEDNGAYYWSHHLDRAWERELQTILDEVHGRYFPNRTELKKNERLDFIELTYLEIIDALIEKWHPPSMNISCSQGMDRGPSLLVLWEVKNTPIDDQTIATHLLTPPLLIHNRPSHTSKIGRFVSAAKRIKKAHEEY